MLQALSENTSLYVAAAGLLGLVVGSFLNVVAYRLPLMMERAWRRDCAEILELPEPQVETPAFNLMLPGSHCPRCKRTIHPLDNIPVLSYLLLQGRCRSCKAKISARYPLVEGLTALVSIIVSWHFGYSTATLAALLLSWGLIVLSLIDFDHQLLPDSLTISFLWLGLFFSLFDVFADSPSSIIGAMAGYLSLWTIYHLFKLITRKEGMGYGDFKLFALLGAWMGWQLLPLVLLCSSLLGAIVGSLLVLVLKRERHRPIPFGPYLAAAGWVALLWGRELTNAYLNTVGLDFP